MGETIPLMVPSREVARVATALRKTLTEVAGG